MKNNLLIRFFIGCVGTGMFSKGVLAASMLTIANAYPGEPPCHVMVPEIAAQCTADGCSLPVPPSSTLKSILISLGCAPASAPTGFENPSPEVKIHSFRSKNAKGYFSEIDSMTDSSNDRTRDLNFCLYGQKNNFCGTATVFRLKDGAKGNGASIVKSFIKDIEIEDPVK